MKATLLLLALAFSTSIFADTKMTDKDCRDLAVSTGVTPFLKENNIELFKVHELDKGSDSSKYFADVMNGLLGNLTELCKKNENTFTIEEFTRKHFASCTSLCTDRVSIFNPIIGKQAKQKDALDVCNSLCKKGFDQLQTLQQGARMAKAANEKSAPDCTGVVSGKGRGIEVKAIEVNVDTGKTTIKTTGK